MRLGFLTILAVVAVFALQPANCAEEIVVRGYEDAFDSLRQQHNPDYRGASVEQAIKALFEKGDDYKGTYSPTEYWKRDGDIRRVKPPSLRYQGRTYFQYSEDNISGITKFDKELELTLRYEDWSGYFRVSDANALAYENDPLRWEKARIRYKHGDTKITAGSFPVVFGRGLAVNMYEDRILETDHELEGVKLEQKLGDGETVLFWGTNKALDDRAASEFSGGRYEHSFGKNLTTGVHAANLGYPELGLNEAGEVNMHDYDIYGGDVSGRVGDFRFYAEAVQTDHPVQEFGTKWDIEGKKGTGHYANIGYYTSGISVLAEVKNYMGLANPYAVLPSLRRYSEQAQAEPEDDKGYAVEMNWNPFKDGSRFQFNYAQGNAHEIKVPYTEAIVAYSSPVSGSTSYVAEAMHVNILNTIHDIQRLTVSRVLNEDWTASTYVEKEKYRFATADSYVDYLIDLEMAYGSEFTIIYTYETTGFAIEDEDSWGLWEFVFKPDPTQEFNLAFGARREGFVCSGGVCRLEPAFDGMRVDYLQRF